MAPQPSSLARVMERLAEVKMTHTAKIIEPEAFAAPKRTQHNVEELPTVDEDCAVDSGYSSQNSSQIAADGLGKDYEEDYGQELYISEHNTTRVFNIDIDASSKLRFLGIRPSVESLLWKYTNKKRFLSRGSRRNPMSIRLLMLGDSLSNAKPAIVVFCIPEMRKKIQHYFDTHELIKAFYAPEEANEPSFQVVVCAHPPQLRGEDSLAAVCWSVAEPEGAATIVYNSPLHLTLCGTPIIFQANGKTRRATLGGVIKVTNFDGTWDLFGLTAGHTARDCILDDDQFSEPGSITNFSGDDSDPSDTDSDLDGSESSHGSKTTYDAGEAATYKGNAPDVEDVHVWDFLHSHHYGYAVVPAFTTGKAKSTARVDQGQSLDWAFVPVPIALPNDLPHAGPLSSPLPITNYRKTTAEEEITTSKEPVIVITASQGIQPGTLLSEPSSILIYPSTTFVDAYLVTLDSSQHFVDGDSGAWVVSQITYELLGYIVATDCLGAAYILRACDIFDDIMKSQHAQDVSLPTSQDCNIKRLSAIRGGLADKFYKNEEADDQATAFEYEQGTTAFSAPPQSQKALSPSTNTSQKETNGHSVRYSVSIDAIEKWFSVTRLTGTLIREIGFLTMTTSIRDGKYYVSADYETFNAAERVAILIASLEDSKFRPQVRLSKLENDILLMMPIPEQPVHGKVQGSRQGYRGSYGSSAVESDSGYSSLSSANATPEFSGQSGYSSKRRPITIDDRPPTRSVSGSQIHVTPHSEQRQVEKGKPEELPDQARLAEKRRKGERREQRRREEELLRAERIKERIIAANAAIDSRVVTKPTKSPIKQTESPIRQTELQLEKQLKLLELRVEKGKDEVERQLLLEQTKDPSK